MCLCAGQSLLIFAISEICYPNRFVVSQMQVANGGLLLIVFNSIS